MPPQARSEQGQFAAKSDESREVRSLRCTDATWQKLGDLAESQGITRADLIERWAAAPVLGNGAASLDQVDQGIAHFLNDPTVTRNGKDRGSVRRALEALREYLSSPCITR